MPIEFAEYDPLDVVDGNTIPPYRHAIDTKLHQQDVFHVSIRDRKPVSISLPTQHTVHIIHEKLNFQKYNERKGKNVQLLSLKDSRRCDVFFDIHGYIINEIKS